MSDETKRLPQFEGDVDWSKAAYPGHVCSTPTEVALYPASLSEALIDAATRRSIAYLGPKRDPLPEQRMEIDAVYVDEVMRAVSQHHASPTPPDNSDLRESIARVMHGAYGSFAWETLDEDQQIPWLNIADAVLSSGLVVPVGEVERVVEDALDLFQMMLARVRRVADMPAADQWDRGWRQAHLKFANELHSALDTIPRA